MSGKERPLFKPAVSEEVEEEFDTHVELRAREYVARGYDAIEARKLALQRFGDIAEVKAICRDLGTKRDNEMKRAALWTEFRQDLRYAWRTLLRTPAFTFVVVLTLGLGIGANTALFSVVKSVLLTPLPYAHPERVVMLWSRWSDFPNGTWVGQEEFQNYQKTVRSLSSIALLDQFEVSITEGSEPERVGMWGVTPNLFATLGVSAELGRTFTAEEATRGHDNVVLLTHGLWQRRFGGDRTVIGRKIYANGEAQTIVGVLPEGFKLPLDYKSSSSAQLYAPLLLDPWNGTLPHSGGSHGYYVIGRLASGASVRSANQELRALTTRYMNEGIYPKTMDFNAYVVAAPDEVAGKMKPALLILLGAVGFVLLIACANVASLLLVRSEDRRREVSVRGALGASRGRLVRQFLTENLLIAGLGGAFGFALAALGVRALLALAPANLPRLPEVSLDAPVLVFTAALSILTAVLFGLLPALHGSRADLQETLKEGGRANTVGRRRLRVRQGMVIGQVAMAVVLVVGAGLMLRSFSHLLGIDPGFDSKNVLTMRVYAPEAYYPKPGDVNGFYERVLNEVRRVPGVRNAGMVRVLPIDTDIGDSGVRIDGYVDPLGRKSVPADWQAASDGYFESMGMKLVEGRFFTAGDRIDTEQVIIVNESFVQKYLGGKSGLDRLVTFGFVPDVPAQRVVGVVKNVKHNGLTGEVKPTFYRPQQQWPVSTDRAQRGMTLVVKGTIEPHRLMEPVRKAIGTIDPRLPASNVKTMSEVLSGAVAQPRFTMVLLLVFGGLALTLALVGMYGVVSYAVAQRRQEMGIRMALGAAPTAIVWLAVRSGLVQTVSGIVLGVASAAALTRVMTGLMYQTTTRDPITYVAVTLLALAATGLASWIPARRAARTDPLSSLRSA